MKNCAYVTQLFSENTDNLPTDTFMDGSVNKPNFQPNPWAYADLVAGVGMGAALVTGLAEKSAFFLGESASFQGLFGKQSFYKPLQLASRHFLKSPLMKKVGVFAAPLAMFAMVYNMARAGSRLAVGDSHNKVGDQIMLLSAALGALSVYGGLHPQFRGVAAVLGLALDTVGMGVTWGQWKGDQVTSWELGLQVGLTLIFGLDHESRQALKVLGPARSFKRPSVLVIDHTSGIPRGRTHKNVKMIHANRYDRPLTSSVERHAFIDARELRPRHCLSMPWVDQGIQKKLRSMRRILARERSRHPFTWKSRGKKILTKLTEEERGGNTIPILVARYNNQGDFYVMDGHHRITTIHLLAALGEIPLSWLRGIPVFCAEIWSPGDAKKLTAGVRLKLSEVLAEPHTGRHSPALGYEALDRLVKLEAQMDPWSLPDAIGTVRAGRTIFREGDDLLQLHERGYLNVPADRLHRYVIDQMAEGNDYDLSKKIFGRVRTDPELCAYIWEHHGMIPHVVGRFLEHMYPVEPERVTAYLKRVLIEKPVPEPLALNLLTWNARNPALQDPDIFRYIQSLTTHPSAAIRFRISRVLTSFPIQDRLPILLKMAEREPEEFLKVQLNEFLMHCLDEASGSSVTELGEAQLWFALAEHLMRAELSESAGRAVVLASQISSQSS